MHLDYTILYHSLPIVIILIIAESVFLMKEKREDRYNFISSLVMVLCNIPLSTIANTLGLYLFTVIYHFRIFSIPGQFGLVWVFLFFADDFSYYWYHRMSHQIRFLWASHKVHHSSQKFTLTSGLRVPWTSGFAGSYLFWSWLPFIGFEPYMILFMKSISAIYQFWIHTETINKMPKWFEAFFNTPAHHRVHHASDVAYLDKNHGGTLIIYDKLFGSYQEEIFKPMYGLTSDINSCNPFAIELDEWKNIITDLKKSKKWKDRVHYLFDSPGWSHDGKCRTTKQLQGTYKKRRKENGIPKTLNARLNEPFGQEKIKRISFQQFI